MIVNLRVMVGAFICSAGIALCGEPRPAPGSPAASRPAERADVDEPYAPPYGPRGKDGGRDRAGMRTRPGRMGRGPAAERPGSTPAAGEPFLSDEQIEHLMRFLARNFPNMHQRLEIARDRNPEFFERMIHRAARLMMPMVRAAREDPQLADTMIREHKGQMHLQELRDRYARTHDATQRDQIRGQMRDEMDRIFETRQERLRLEVKRLQQRLDRAKQDLADQENDKDRIIEQRLTRMLDEAASHP